MGFVKRFWKKGNLQLNCKISVYPIIYIIYPPILFLESFEIKPSQADRSPGMS